MRYHLATLAVLLSAVALAASWSEGAGTVYNFTDCDTGGEAAQTISPGTYMMTVTGEDTWVCFSAAASTCASGGTKYPMGFGVIVKITTATSSRSCRSAGGAGDVTFSPGAVVP